MQLVGLDLDQARRFTGDRGEVRRLADEEVVLTDEPPWPVLDDNSLLRAAIVGDDGDPPSRMTRRAKCASSWRKRISPASAVRSWPKRRNTSICSLLSSGNAAPPSLSLTAARAAPITVRPCLYGKTLPERRSGEGGVRAGQQGTVLVAVAVTVGAGRVTGALVFTGHLAWLRAVPPPVTRGAEPASGVVSR